MSHKKNNNYLSTKTSPPKIDKEALQSEALLLYTMKNDSDENLLKESEEFCYLVSEKWWESYEIYLGYSEIIDDKPLKKSFGQKIPGRINDDIIADQDRVYKIPLILEHFQYLTTYLRPKALENEAYILVDVKLWDHIYNLYGGKMIKRPLNHNYSYAVCDDLQKSHIVLLTHDKIDELLTDPKTKKSEISTILGSFKNIQFHETWKMKDLVLFLERILEAETGKSNWNVKVWRLNNYIYLEDFWKAFEDFLSMFTEIGKFLIEAKELTQEKYQGIRLGQLLKDGYYLVIEAKIKEEEPFYFEEYRLTSQNMKDLQGYCEFCNEKELSLKFTCLCNEVFYCREKCKYKDQHFHFNVCERSYDSDSDNEEETKEMTPESFIYDRGLKNLGNTCYMNSVLQAIKRTKIPEDLFYSNNYLKSLKEKKNEENGKSLLTKKFSKLMKRLSSPGNDPVAPWNLKQTFGFYYPNFKGYHQHDSQEFMAYLFNGLHEELSLNLTEKQEKSATKQIDYSNPDEYLSASLNSSFSKISELFQGLFSSEIRCPQCSHSSTQYDEFNVVSLPLYNKEDQYNIQINYIPKDISQNFETKNYKFSNSQELTLKDLLEIIKKDLQLPNEIPLLTAIVEDDKIQELIKENTILVKELKTRLELKRKKFIVYEMPVDWDATFDNLIYVCFSTEIKKSGITFKKLVGTPRVIVTKPQANYEDLYVSIMDLFKVVYPDQIIQFNEIKENLNLVQKNLEILHENNNNIDNNNGLVENHLSNMRSEINLSISQNKTKISKTQSSSENNETHLKKEIISEKSPNKRIEVEKTTESQIKDAATVIESTKTGQPPSRGKKNKKAPRVSKRKKTEKKNEIASINEEEPKIFEPSSEISSQKIQIKDQMDSDPETLLQDFILCLPYYVKFVNKMKNIHACLLCHKKNCDSCALTLTNPLSLIELLNICQTNQIQMEINIFFPNEVPKVIEQTLEVTTHSSSSATVNSNPSILQCLDIFSEKEVLSSENMWFCPVCDEKKQAEKTMKLCYVSQYLVFHLKRFKSVEGSGSSKNSKKVKNNQPIDYPINDLDMTSYVKDLVPHMRTANSKVFKYRLIAVVLHEGKLDEGHYMSLGRCRDGVWRKFDDERVQEIQEKEVCHKNAYLLFYELCK